MKSEGVAIDEELVPNVLELEEESDGVVDIYKWDAETRKDDEKNFGNIFNLKPEFNLGTNTNN